jgi:hypothetical protein
MTVLSAFTRSYHIVVFDVLTDSLSRTCQLIRPVCMDDGLKSSMQGILSKSLGRDCHPGSVYMASVVTEASD